MKSQKTTDSPLRQTMCATCPFRPGSKYADLASGLAESAINEASRICHATGSNNGINRRTGIRPHLCRGARNVQLTVFFALRVIEAPTDDAWNRQRVAQGFRPTKIKDP